MVSNTVHLKITIKGYLRFKTASHITTRVIFTLTRNLFFFQTFQRESKKTLANLSNCIDGRGMYRRITPLLFPVTFSNLFGIDKNND